MQQGYEVQIAAGPAGPRVFAPAHLCNHVPLIAQLVLPHEVRLLKLHLPQDGHVWVDPDPQQRRVSTAEGTGDGEGGGGKPGGTKRHMNWCAMSHSMADRSMSTSSPFIRGIFFFLFLGKETVNTDEK